MAMHITPVSLLSVSIEYLLALSNKLDGDGVRRGPRIDPFSSDSA